MTPPTPAQLIAEARKQPVLPTGKGEQHCDLCGRMSYVGDGIDVWHRSWCPSYLLNQLADALTAALQQAEELQRAVTQSAREMRRLEKRIAELEGASSPLEFRICQQCGVTWPCLAHPTEPPV